MVFRLKGYSPVEEFKVNSVFRENKASDPRADDGYYYSWVHMCDAQPYGPSRNALRTLAAALLGKISQRVLRVAFRLAVSRESLVVHS
ncbi:hypothetical protein TcasGA2_TC005843 [Tribolium castaneum]|uniref:Uncharacterized protein n=1 Tax=Tribolium castaneum TaxID=7070 RepID=D6WVY9_TRICA|nr:hypothetical protein TcasGA2_TC005843 [Tribolium castaneum]